MDINIAKMYITIGVVSIIPAFLKSVLSLESKRAKERKMRETIFWISTMITPLVVGINGIIYLQHEKKIYAYLPLLWCVGVTMYGYFVGFDENKDEIKEEKVILSPIISAEQISDWRCRTLLTPHEVIRRGLNTLTEISDNKYYQMSNMNELKNKINKFYQWYNDIFYVCIYNHHNDEEDIYFPWLVEKTEKLPPKFGKDHAELVELVTEIKNSQNKFKNITNANDFRKQVQYLNNLCLKLKDFTIQHLNEEEETIPNLLKKYDIKKEDEDKIINAIVQKLGLSGNKILLPWIIDIMYEWGGEHIVNQFKQNVPTPILLINYLFWTKHYQTYNKGIIQQIMSYN